MVQKVNNKSCCIITHPISIIVSISFFHIPTETKSTYVTIENKRKWYNFYHSILFKKWLCFPFKKGRKIHFNGILLTYWNCLRNTYYNAALVTSGIGIWRSFIIVFASICSYHNCKKSILASLCFLFVFVCIATYSYLYNENLEENVMNWAMNYNNFSLIQLYVFQKYAFNWNVSKTNAWIP